MGVLISYISKKHFSGELTAINKIIILVVVAVVVAVTVGIIIIIP